MTKESLNAAIEILGDKDHPRVSEVAAIIEKHFIYIRRQLDESDKNLLSLTTNIMKLKKDYDLLSRKKEYAESKLSLYSQQNIEYLAAQIKTVDGVLVLPDGTEVITDRKLLSVAEWKAELLEVFTNIETWCKQRGYYIEKENKMINEDQIGKYEAPMFRIRTPGGSFVIETIGYSSPMFGRIDFYSWPPSDMMFTITDFHKGWTFYDPTLGDTIAWSEESFLTCMDVLAKWDDPKPKSKPKPKKDQYDFSISEEEISSYLQQSSEN
jgi:hypothetical protein